MIIAKAPYRISFFGGGSDYPEWFEQHGGAFLSTAIDHFVFILIRRKFGIGDHKYRVLWRIIEEVRSREDIQHPVVREALKMLDIDLAMDITYFGDLPSRTGLGSSSSFTVAFLAALHALTGKEISELELSRAAIDLERNRLKETVGVQDQIATAFGGFNYGEIRRDGSFSLSKVLLPSTRMKSFNERLFLAYTGETRHASKVAEQKVKNFPAKEKVVARLQDMASEGRKILESNDDLDHFGELLHEAWVQKRGLSDCISNPFIDDLYEIGRNNGAIGGKLLGAGGGGFMLFFAKVGMEEQLKEALKDYIVVPVNVNAPGVHVSLHDDFKHVDSYSDIWNPVVTS